MDRDHAKIAIAVALIQAGRSDEIRTDDGLEALRGDVERIVDTLLPRATGGSNVDVTHT